MNLKQRVQSIENEIKQTLVCAGSKSDKAQIVCVTKYAEIEAVIEIIKLGYYDIAENYLQEVNRKILLLKKALSPEQIARINWHFIGHLQRNKAADVIKFAQLIQSVDSLRLARRIDQIAAKENIAVNILVQVNISAEESKFGISFSAAEKLVKEILKLPNINILGLMGIGPLVEDPEDSRPGFKRLKLFFDKINQDLSETEYPLMSVLSMGMSNDYKIAVQEGSTMVRIGSAIFKGE
ncbi:MAG: YggS family pyridoxal phosphate-dependent enzyme [Candidatus Omnitrophica bacterium]|nr:YggS family pyridoxal phosphate-dependent enzyme [Candidatus Omnitrophota bacterium]